MQILSTLIPVSLFGALILSPLIGEQWLNSADKEVKVFTIEQATEHRLLAEENNRVAAIADTSLADSMVDIALARAESGEPLLSFAERSGLSLDNRKSLLRKVSARLIKLERYEDLQQQIQPLPIDERVQLGVQFSYALALARLNQTDEALSQYRQLLARQPVHQAAAINLGLLLYQNQRYAEAVFALDFAASIASGERKAKALSASASSLRELGRLEEAEQKYMRSIEYRPGHASTWAKLAEVRAQIDKPFELVSLTFQRSLALDNAGKRPRRKTADYHLQRLDFNAATRHYQALLEQTPGDMRVMRKLAWALFESGHGIESEKIWQRIANDESDRDVRLLARHLLTSLSEQERDLRTLAVDNAEANYARAVILQREGKFAESLAFLSSISKDSDWYARAVRRKLLMSDVENISDALIATVTGLNTYPAELQALKAQQAFRFGHLDRALHWSVQAMEEGCHLVEPVVIALQVLKQRQQYREALALIANLDRQQKNRQALQGVIVELQRLNEGAMMESGSYSIGNRISRQAGQLIGAVTAFL